VEREDSSTEIGSMALKPGTGPAFNAAEAAAVKVVFYINADVRRVCRFNAVEGDGDCFKDNRWRNLWR
jgi:hypothetical protein